MKLVFAVDAIFPPLTGIGRYALELAHGLANNQSRVKARFFHHGRFVTNPALRNGAVAAASSGLRQRLARSVSVVKLYDALSPSLYRWRLRRYADHLFHSPNYFLPPFDGPSIATVHDLSTLLYPQFHPAARVAYMDVALPATLKRATHLITVSEFIRSQVIALLSWPAERVTAIGLGMDALFAPRSEAQTQAVLRAYGLQHGAYTLCVATIEPRKNIDRLIEAHQALPQGLRKRYPLVLAGAPGWNSEALHARIKRSQGPELRYLHYVPDADLYALYAGARLFAFPSIYEGFGLPVLEAMASGVPVLTSNQASLPEVGGSAVLQVDPLDVDALREALNHCLQDEPWRLQAVAQGLQRASERSWQRCFDETLALYARFAPGTRELSS